MTAPGDAAPGTPAAVARSYLQSFARGDPDVIVAHVSEHFVNEHASALGSSCTGRDEYRRRLPGFLSAFTDLRYDVKSVLVDGPEVAATYRLHAVSDGHPIDIPGVMVMTVVDGLVQRRTDYWDSLTFLRQTGNGR